MKQKKRKHLKTLFETLGENYQFNGTILAAEDGEILYHHSSGYAEWTEKRPLQTNSLFELASRRKGFLDMKTKWSGGCRVFRIRA